MIAVKLKIRGAVLAISCLAFLCGCQKKVSKYTDTDFAMGTTISEVFYGEKEACETAADEVITILKETEEKQISWRRKGSQVYEINHSKEAVAVEQETATWLKRSLQIARDSDGALNPGVGSLAQLWDIGGENARVPEKEEIEIALKKIDYQSIEIEDQEVITNPEEVQVDLGAVGKGIGADQVMDYLKEKEGIEGAIVSVGGSLCVYGQKEEGASWELGIQDPRNETGNMVGSVKVDGECFVSTSGDYEKYIEEDGKRYHHILDSNTGYPSDSGLISVTIVCDSGIDSDGLSTACFVLGMEKSLSLLEKYNAGAIFINEDKEVYVTDGVEFELQNTEEYTICEIPSDMK